MLFKINGIRETQVAFTTQIQLLKHVVVSNQMSRHFKPLGEHTTAAIEFAHIYCTVALCRRIVKLKFYILFLLLDKEWGFKIFSDRFEILTLQVDMFEH